MAFDDMRAELAESGVRLEALRNGVLNIQTPDREMTRADVEQFRAVLAREGYTERESWTAWQNVSWMSDGTFCGVSFRVQAPEQEY